MARSRDIIKKKIYWKKIKKILDFFLLFRYNYFINKIKQKSMKGVTMNHSIKNYKEYGFDSPPFLSDDYQNQYFKLVLAQEKAKNMLKDRPNFVGIIFNDVGASGIQIQAKNKQVPINISDATIKYDFSNIDEAVDECVKSFIETDNEKSITSALQFYNDGCKYGWD